MALKVLMLRKKIDNKNKSLEELRAKLKGFEQREAELATALNEAETDEEISTVEDSIKELDEEKTAVEADVQAAESEVTEFETELTELETAQRSAEPTQRSKRPQPITNTGGTGMIVRTGFFKGKQRNIVKELVEREDVNDFLTAVKEGNFNERASSVGNGELLIPDVLLEMLRDELHRYSKLISKVYLKPIKGTSRQIVAGEIPEGIWMEACESLQELKISFSQLEMDGYKVGGYMAICNANLEDMVGIASEILDALGQAIGLAVDKAIVYGTGKKMPLGIVTRLAQAIKPDTWSTKAPKWLDLQSNIATVTGDTATDLFSNIVLHAGKAKSNYGSGGKFFAMNENTHTLLLSKLVTFNMNGALVASMNDTMPIINGDIVILPFMADGDIVGGYGQQYMLAERAGATLASSVDVQFIEDNTVYKGTARYDGAPIMGQGFVAFNIDGKEVTKSVKFAPEKEETETP